MKRTQLVAVLLVAIMAVAMVPAIAAAQSAPAQTPTVGQPYAPTLTIFNTPECPAINQLYTVYGKLSWSGTGIVAPLRVWVMWPQDGPWQWHPYPFDVKSDQLPAGSGNYHFHTSSSTHLVWWKVRYDGSQYFLPKNVYKEVLIGQTVTRAWTSNAHPGWLAFTISGDVKTPCGGALAWKAASVKLEYRLPNGAWTPIGMFGTNGAGAWTAGPYVWGWSTIYFRATYVPQGADAALYWPSTSSEVTVN